MATPDVFSKSKEEGTNNFIKVLILATSVAIIAVAIALVLILQNNIQINNQPLSYPSSYTNENNLPVSSTVLKETANLEELKDFKISSRTAGNNYDLEFSGSFGKNMTFEEIKTNNVISKEIIKGENFQLSFEIAGVSEPKAVETSPIIINSSAFGILTRIKEGSVYIYSNDQALSLNLNCSASGKTINAPCGVPQVKLLDKYLNISCTGSATSTLLNCENILKFITVKYVAK